MIGRGVTTPLGRARWLALLLPAALLAGAFASQYLWGLFPCEMCWWQRWPHVLAVALALLAFVAPRPARGVLVMLAALAIATSGAIGVFHAGVEYGWWQGITACASTLGGEGDIMDRIMNAPLVRCDVAPWTLWGVSLAGFNAIISLAGALGVTWLATRPNRH